MSKRLYPFGSPVSQNANTSSGNSQTVTWTQMTVYKPNPFHGWRRAVFAFDEWAHRHNLNARGPLRWLCNWWDEQLCKSPGHDA